MIRESGSEKKKARFSDRSRSEVTKRERSGETSASAKLRKDTCERVKRAPVRICVCVCVCVKERVRDRQGEQGEGTREEERDRTPSTPILLPPTFSISSTASSSFSSLPPHVPVPSFSQAESNQYFGKVRGRSIRACRSRHRPSFAQISRESATNDQRPIGEDRRWSGSSRFDGPRPKVYGEIPHLDDTKSRSYVCNAISPVVSSFRDTSKRKSPDSTWVEGDRKKAGTRSSRFFLRDV